MRHAFAFAGLFLLAATLRAALPVPRESPAATLRETVGITDIEIVYHRPAVKGRKIWGGLVPYGEVWRLGANEATTLQLGNAVKLAGHDVPAGTYGVFAVPGPEKWTLILNKRAQQWGAYFYKPEEDFLRFEVTPTAGPDAEWMTFALTPQGWDRLSIDFAWEKLRWSIPVEVDVDGLVWSRYDAGLADPKATADDYLTAAKFALQRNQRLDEAMAWADKSLQMNPGFWQYEAKGRLLHAKGRTAEAIPLLVLAVEDAKGKAPQGYIDGLEKTIAEWKAGLPARGGN
ncbi:MAG: DUF2911 domain-containing protein [Thermoanaerobaculia bacterium]